MKPDGQSDYAPVTMPIPMLSVEIVTEKRITNMTMNFGPQHPAAHGVLRLVMQINGEVCLLLYVNDSVAQW